MLRKIGIIGDNLKVTPEKVEDIYTARPRKLKYGNGEIMLYNYSPEEADAIQKLLLDEAKEITNLPQAGDIVELKEESIEIVDQTTLSETALDLYLDPKTKEYKVVHVKYNPVSKSAKVTNFIPGGSFRLAGTNALKVELVKLGKI